MKFNKILSVLLATLIVLSSACIFVSADETTEPTIVVTAGTAKPGEDVDVTISLENNPGFVSLILDVGYDASVMSIKAVTDAGFVSGVVSHTPNFALNPYRLYWYDAIATTNFTGNGDIVTITFTVAEDAEDGDYPITVTYDNSEDHIFDKDFNPIDFEVANDNVTVSSVPAVTLLGDVDNNGVVNSLDVIKLARHVATWVGYETIHAGNADVNADGAITALDVTILTRHWAGWSAYKTLPYTIAE